MTDRPTVARTAASPVVPRVMATIVAVTAVAVPSLLVDIPVTVSPPVQPVTRSATALPATVPPPPVEPVTYRAITPEDARGWNAGVPFVPGPIAAARPFRFAGAAENRLRAEDCLAAAALYEAGDDARGQAAVAQVVLNRLRHPAFPKTVCGVVFQGSERRTGCQFTFTCDGALARDVPAPFWERARRVAAAALAGSVFADVGYATHYHTDWVVPYWSASLDKVAAVDTHLFFRWTGWWGTPPAFRRMPEGREPRVIQLAGRFPEHRLPEVLAAEAAGALATAALADGTAPIAALPDDPDSFALTLPAALDPAAWPALAVRACGTRARCKVLAWREPKLVPAASRPPLSVEALAGMSFSYLRDRDRGYERSFWNCAQLSRPPGACMRRTVAPVAAAGPAAAPTTSDVDTPLTGVRRRTPPTPAPRSSPSPRPSE